MSVLSAALVPGGGKQNKLKPIGGPAEGFSEAVRRPRRAALRGGHAPMNQH